MRREGRHHAAPTLRARAAGRRQAEGAHAGGLLRVPPPVEPQRERLGLRDLPIEPQERDGVVGRALVREALDLRGRAARRGEREEPGGGIGTDPEPGQGEGICGGERRQRWPAPAPLQRAEHERLVPDDRASHPAAQLVLGVPLPERRRGDLSPGEGAVAQRVGERPLRDVLAAAGCRGDEAAGELAPARVVAARDDAGRAERILRHTAPAEGQTIERDRVRRGALTRHREVGLRRSRGGAPAATGAEGGPGREGACVARREIWVSTERACTSAPASGWLSGPTTVRVMMSVVVPTWAAARDAASESTSARSSGNGRARIGIPPDSPAPPPPPRPPFPATAPPAAGRSRSPLRRAPPRNAGQSAGATPPARGRSTPPRTAWRRRALARPSSHPGRPYRRHTRTYERGPARDHPAPPNRGR